MELNNNILYSLLAEKKLTIALPFTKEELKKACQIKSVTLLVAIVGFLINSELDDFACIDAIVTLLNENGIGTGERHNF